MTHTQRRACEFVKRKMAGFTAAGKTLEETLFAALRHGCGAGGDPSGVSQRWL